MKKQRYMISRRFRAIQPGKTGEGFIYHSLYGNGTIASAALISLLRELTGDGKTFSHKDVCLDKELFNHLLGRGIVVPAGRGKIGLQKTTPSKSSDRIDHLRLCITESCNMNCSYCYVDCGGKKTGMMSFATARTAIEKYYNYLREHRSKGKITFFGGEPLLNWECLKSSMAFISKIDPKRLHFDNVSLVTNGTLIDAEKAEFIAKHDINVGVSLDGPQNANDSARVMGGGEGSYKYIKRGIGLLQKAGVKKVAISCTVADHNSGSLNSLVSFASRKKIPIAIHPVHPVSKEKRSPLRTTADRLADCFFDAFKFAHKNKVPMTGPWMWPVKKAFGKLNGLNHCAACGREMSVDHNGKVKPCPGSNLIYGSIDNFGALLKSAARKRLLKRTAPAIKGCDGCPIEGLCGGGCMVEAERGSGNVFRKGGDCGFMRGMFSRIIHDYLKTRSGNPASVTQALRGITKGEAL